MKSSIINARVQKRTLGRRRAGLRLVQMWVPDTRHPGFAEECRRQSLAVALADQADEQLERLMNAAAAHAKGWTG